VLAVLAAVFLVGVLGNSIVFHRNRDVLYQNGEA